MTLGIAIGAGLLLGIAIDLAVFAVADQFEVNLFHIGDC